MGTRIERIKVSVLIRENRFHPCSHPVKCALNERSPVADCNEASNIELAPTNAPGAFPIKIGIPSALMGLIPIFLGIRNGKRWGYGG